MSSELLCMSWNVKRVNIVSEDVEEAVRDAAAFRDRRVRHVPEIQVSVGHRRTKLAAISDGTGDNE